MGASQCGVCTRTSTTKGVFIEKATDTFPRSYHQRKSVYDSGEIYVYLTSAEASNRTGLVKVIACSTCVTDLKGKHSLSGQKRWYEITWPDVGEGVADERFRNEHRRTGSVRSHRTVLQSHELAVRNNECICSTTEQVGLFIPRLRPLPPPSPPSSSATWDIYLSMLSESTAEATGHVTCGRPCAHT